MYHHWQGQYLVIVNSFIHCGYFQSYVLLATYPGTFRKPSEFVHPSHKISTKSSKSMMLRVWVLLFQGMLAHDLCVGIIGGRPKHSLYFVGFQGIFSRILILIFYYKKGPLSPILSFLFFPFVRRDSTKFDKKWKWQDLKRFEEIWREIMRNGKKCWEI